MNQLSYLKGLLVLLCLFGAITPRAQEIDDVTSVRVAVFNIRELNTDILTNVDETGRGLDSQVIAAAEIIQRIRPDVLLICEIDHDYTSLEKGLEENARRFQRHYLSHGSSPIEFDHVYAGANNTGILSGADLNNDNIVATPEREGTPEYANDCYGWGEYRGQYSMAVLSKYPIDEENIRTFQKFLWKDLPGNHIPTEYYSEEAINTMRLSSKSHWDIPIIVGDKAFHLLACHPTPQGFDGEENRNGKRNYDELLLWKLYLDNSPALTDDQGKTGGLGTDKQFVIAGDLNSAPTDGTKFDEQLAIELLLDHPRVQESGASIQAEGALQGREPGPPNYPERHTIGHRRSARLDYALPSKDLKLTGGGMFWPDATKDIEGASLAHHASDHRMIWIDIDL